MDNTPKSPETTSHDYYILNDDNSKSAAYTLDELAMLKTNEVITKDTLIVKNGKDPKTAGAFFIFDNDDKINTSGTGHSARLPKELNTYNIGAGILSIFWGYNHFPKYKIYWSAFIVISCFNILFYLKDLFKIHIYTFPLLIYKISSNILLITTIIWMITTIIFLTKGNEIAWKNRKFKDIKQFKDIQRKWNIWGYTIFISFFMFISNQLILFIFIGF